MALELSAIFRIGFVVYAFCSIEMTILLVGLTFSPVSGTFGGCSRPSVGPVPQGLGRRTIMAGLGNYFRVSGAKTRCAAPFATIYPSARPSVLSDVRELVLGR